MLNIIKYIGHTFMYKNYYFHVKLHFYDMIFFLHKSVINSILLHVSMLKFTNSLFNYTKIYLRIEDTKFSFYCAYLYAFFFPWKK